jgi:hypothetical protein
LKKPGACQIQPPYEREEGKCDEDDDDDDEDEDDLQIV